MDQKQINNIITTVLSNSFILGKFQLYKVNKYQKAFGIDKITEKEKELREKILVRDSAVIKNSVINKKLNVFKGILEKNFDKDDIKNFNDNIKWIMIQIVSSLKYVECYGMYIADKNLLLVENNTKDDILFHELFHLASAKPTLKYKRTGFLLNYKKDSIGYGLNEGYTELLTSRYLNKESNIYLLEQNIAWHLENIIGKEKMQSLYLNADIFGLINKLKKYYSVDEIEKFLLNLDIYTCYYKEVKIASKKLENKIDDLIEEMNLFLLKGYLKKLKEKQSIIDKSIIIDYLKCFYYTKDNPQLADKVNEIIYSVSGEEYLLDKDDLILEEKGESI